MAILSIELEEIDPGQMLIRVRTVDDVVEKAEPEERAFSVASQAVEYLREWLDGWTGLA